MTIIAAIQMASGPNVQGNLTEAARLISDSVKRGAELVVLPENFAYMGIQEPDKLAVAETAGTGQIQEFLASQAKKNKIWIVGGSIPMKTEDPKRVFATSQSRIQGVYPTTTRRFTTGSRLVLMSYA